MLATKFETTQHACILTFSCVVRNGKNPKFGTILLIRACREASKIAIRLVNDTKTHGLSLLASCFVQALKFHIGSFYNFLKVFSVKV